jgi:hypothetical protein
MPDLNSTEHVTRACKLCYMIHSPMDYPSHLYFLQNAIELKTSELEGAFGFFF